MPKFRNAQQLSDFLGNFNTVANANLATLTTLSAGDITALTAIKTNLDAAIADRIAKEEAAEAATVVVKSNMDAGNAALDLRLKKVVSVAGLPNALATQLGLHLRDTVPTSVVAVAPTNLTAKGADTGVTQLIWKSGGNASGTTYVIEARPGSTGAFVFVNITTKTRFSHTGQTSGVRMEYRVKARRATNESPFSNTAVVYALA